MKSKSPPRTRSAQKKLNAGRPNSSDRRDQLVATALRLFRRHGFHATGIDTILAQSGVAKMTLYKHFRTKDDLIIAALRHRDAAWVEWFRTTVEKSARTPRQRLLAVFDALDRWFRCDGTGEQEFCGCAFINVAGEYADPTHPIHVAAAEHKRRVTAYVTDLARAAGAADPLALGRHLSLLAEGAIVQAHVAGDLHAARHARKAAELLIAASDARDGHKIDRQAREVPARTSSPPAASRTP